MQWSRWAAKGLVLMLAFASVAGCDAIGCLTYCQSAPKRQPR